MSDVFSVMIILSSGIHGSLGSGLESFVNVVAFFDTEW